MRAKSRRTSASLGRGTKEEEKLKHRANNIGRKPLSPHGGREGEAPRALLVEGATNHAGDRREPGNNKVGEDMTRKRRVNKPVKTRIVCLQRILAREGEAPVALLPEGATRAPVTI
jgi:hypothetical protein